MEDPLATHTYDGKIDKSILSLEDINLSLEEKKYRGNQLLICAKEIMSNVAINFLEDIILNMGTPSNIDDTNKLNADDLICLCYIYSDNLEFMKVLETQLEDMPTGFCPQGRTHRLFQVLLAFGGD